MVVRAAGPPAVSFSGAPALRRSVRKVGAALLATTVAAVAAALTIRGRVDLLATVGSMVGVGAVICWKRPNERVGWLLLVAGLLFGTSSTAVWSIDVVNSSVRPPPIAVFAAWLDEWVWLPMLTTFFVALPMLLPDGRPSSPSFGRLLRVMVIVMAAWTVTAMFSARVADEIQPRMPGIANPVGLLPLDDVENLPTRWYLLASFFVSMTIAAVSVVTRYRRSIGRERLQLRWIAYGTLATIIGFVIVTPMPVTQSIRDWLLAFVVPLMPVSVGVAVLRHNLYDIDRLISRTVAYGAATALLAATYLALVFLLRAAVPVHGDLAVAASTLAVAALFNPLRRRVQRVVDRRFNRASFDAALTVDAFGERLRNEFDLTAVARDLAAVVTRTMQPTSLSLWIADEPRRRSQGAARTLTGSASRS